MLLRKRSFRFQHRTVLDEWERGEIRIQCGVECVLLDGGVVIEFDIPSETPNMLIVSGEVFGVATYAESAAAGMEHGLLVTAKHLKVIG